MKRLLLTVALIILPTVGHAAALTIDVKGRALAYARICRTSVEDIRAQLRANGILSRETGLPAANYGGKTCPSDGVSSTPAAIAELETRLNQVGRDRFVKEREDMARTSGVPVLFKAILAEHPDKRVPDAKIKMLFDFAMFHAAVAATVPAIREAK